VAVCVALTVWYNKESASLAQGEITKVVAEVTSGANVALPFPFHPFDIPPKMPVEARWTHKRGNALLPPITALLAPKFVGTKAL